MTTSYEIKFIKERIDYQYINDWLQKNSLNINDYVSCSLDKIINYKMKISNDTTLIFNNKEDLMNTLIEKLARELDKDILTICYEIRPINKERLRKISKKQWQKFGEKYNMKITETFIKSRSLFESIRLDDFIERNNYHQSAILAKASLYPNLDICNYMETTKAIHDLIWELESL
jgi:hypothetical protein